MHADVVEQSLQFPNFLQFLHYPRPSSDRVFVGRASIRAYAIARAACAATESQHHDGNCKYNNEQQGKVTKNPINSNQRELSSSAA